MTQAIKYHLQALDVDPKDLKTLYELADDYYKESDLASAKFLVGKCLKLAEESMDYRLNPFIQMLRANILRKRKEYNESIRICCSLLEHRNNLLKQMATICLGFCYLEKYKLDPTENLFNLAKNKLSPLTRKFAHACCGLVFLYCERAKIKKELSYYDQQEIQTLLQRAKTKLSSQRS